MDQINVNHKFHAVGHGTFFTGSADVNSKNIFRWIYDCGSWRSTHVTKRINDLTEDVLWSPGVTIDLVAISHFDNDHINGFEDLLRNYRVKWLVLPYMELKQRLEHAMLLGSGVRSAMTASFALDPLGYLSARGLSENIDGILLIQGGIGGGVYDIGNELPDPLELYGNNKIKEIKEIAEWVVPIEYEIDANLDVKQRIRIQSHREPVRAPGLPIEFSFFNKTLPDDRAGKSGKPIDLIAKEVDEIIKRFNLLNSSKPPMSGWRDALKACYFQNFGDGQKRNEISLSILMRPISESSHISQWWFFCENLDSSINYVDVHSQQKSLLLTGDLTMNREVISEMMSHFGWRWYRLGLVQIPHHGAKKSWAKGNVHMFPYAKFVHCVPTYPGKKRHHPHPSVEEDLAGSQVYYANYEKSVVQSYGFYGRAGV